MHIYHPIPLPHCFITPPPSPAANLAFIWAAVDPDPDSGSCRSQIPAETNEACAERAHLRVLQRWSVVCNSPSSPGAWQALSYSRHSWIQPHISLPPLLWHQCPLLWALLLVFCNYLHCSFLCSGMAATLPDPWELQLLPHPSEANLLCYYDAFIQQGGDDVSSSARLARTSFSSHGARRHGQQPLTSDAYRKLCAIGSQTCPVQSAPSPSLPVCSIPSTSCPKCRPHCCWEWRPWWHPSQSAKCLAVACVDPGKGESGNGNSSAAVSPLQSGSEPRFWAGHGTESEHSLSPAELGSPLPLGTAWRH